MGLLWHGFSGGSMEQVVLVNCALAAQAPASAGPWACAHGTEDVAPTGAENRGCCPYRS